MILCLPGSVGGVRAWGGRAFGHEGGSAQFAGLVARDAGDHLVGLRQLVRRQLPSHEVAQRLDGQGRAADELHHGVDGLAPLGVRQADDGGVRDLGVLQHRPSTSAGKMFAPPEMMRSTLRSAM